MLVCTTHSDRLAAAPYRLKVALIMLHNNAISLFIPSSLVIAKVQGASVHF